jgi:UDP-glucose 4-epimerase
MEKKEISMRIALFYLASLFAILHPFLYADGPQDRCVLIVGGAGYIGSHVNKMLKQEGYQTLVLDNLSRGSQSSIPNTEFIKGDMRDTALLDAIFTNYKIDAVMHFAGYKYVDESIKEPLKYYINNVAYTMNLLDAMLRHQVNIFIFSSSAAIFGIPPVECITEETPCNPINPYGHSKLMVETILKDLDKSCGLRFCALRYFNVAGGDPEGIIKNTQIKEFNLIPVILRSIQNFTSMHIYGTDYPTSDGTCIRDYIHLEDLGEAHILAMKKLFKGAPSEFYNLGTGRGFSVKEVVAAVERVTGQRVNAIESIRRPGDPAILISSSEKAKKELEWQPKYESLEVMIEHACKAM